MKYSRESMQGKWGMCVATGLLYMVIQGISTPFPVVGGFASLLLSGPLMLGWNTFSLTVARREPATMELLFSGFSRFGKALGLYLLMVLYILLYSLLLIIPGIIAAIGYSQAFFILSDHPELDTEEILRRSKKMMDGHKMRFFLLSLRFFGLVLLSALTLFIGLLWLLPYFQVTLATFYLELRSAQAENPASTGGPSGL